MPRLFIQCGDLIDPPDDAQEPASLSKHGSQFKSGVGVTDAVTVSVIDRKGAESPSHTDATVARGRFFARSFATTLVAAGVVLLSILVVAVLPAPAARSLGEAPPFVVGDLSDVASILVRNAVVLLMFGLIAGLLRPATRGSSSRSAALARMERRVGMVVLALVVVWQVVAQGRHLAEISGYLRVPAWRLVIGVTPHAWLEIAALLLPVCAVMAPGRGVVARSRAPITAAITALALLGVAACIEVYVSPRAYHAFNCTESPPDALTADGTCPPPPCPRLSPDSLERRYGVRMIPKMERWYHEHCEHRTSLHATS